jgi:tripartite-type tricarboxylate transporter receptor subunit TctC
MTGTKFTHIPYRGSPPAQADLIGGRIQVIFDNLTASVSLIRGGKLHALAVSSRTPALPDVPPISDFVPDYDAYSWNGLTAPKGCPAQVVATLNAAVNAIAADPAFRAQLADIGNSAIADTPEGFGKLIAADAEKWGKVVEIAGIKPQ